MSSSTSEDILSIDDVIDLNHEYYTTHDLHSIDDDELKRFHRDLVTPAPSLFNEEFRQHYRRPISRGGESVMLFKKINNGDEDVSFDLVSSELRDFYDTDTMSDDTFLFPIEPKKKITPVILNYQQRKSLIAKEVSRQVVVPESLKFQRSSGDLKISRILQDHSTEETKKPSSQLKQYTSRHISEEPPKRIIPFKSTRLEQSRRNDIVQPSDSTNRGGNHYRYNRPIRETTRDMDRSRPSLKNTTIETSTYKPIRSSYEKLTRSQERQQDGVGSKPINHRHYDTTFETNHKSLSSPRLRTMSSFKSMPTTTDEVKDSAKQVLASIRERRKSTVDREQRYSGLSNEFRSKLNLHPRRSSAGINNITPTTSNRRYNDYDNKITTRLPQRSSYYQDK